MSKMRVRMDRFERYVMWAALIVLCWNCPLMILVVWYIMKRGHLAD